MPPDMEVSMRHTKLTPQEAALLAGELNKPSWESRNEGIHERVSFEDTIWGFDLAGGSFYKTPLRVTSVKPDSRAEKAGIRPGDRLKRINDIDTSTLTIQEAHDIIVESGIHLKIAVTSPDDEEDSYNYYEDPIMEAYDPEAERRLEDEKARKRMVHAKVSSYWSLQWPWVSKKRLIYRESNCFMVNSKYEEARRVKYPLMPALRYTDDIALFQKDADKLKNIDDNQKETPLLQQPTENENSRQQKLANGNADSDSTPTDDEKLSHVSEDEQLVNHNSSVPSIMEDNDVEINEDKDLKKPIIEEPEETNDDESIAKDSVTEDVNGQNSSESDILSSTTENLEDNPVPITIEENRLAEEEDEQVQSEDDVLNEVLGKTNDIAPNDEDNILDSILSDDGQNLENSEDNNER